MRKGFTLIELLVVIVIIGILAAIALPNYAKVKDRAREAQVKSGIHTIQVALERYATDEPDGHYPPWLYGGDWYGNWDSDPSGFGSTILDEHEAAQAANGVDGTTFNCTDVYGPGALCSVGYVRSGLEYISLWKNVRVSGQSTWFGMDPLLRYGVITQYPRNPFAQAAKLACVSQGDFASIAGRDSQRMFDIAHGVGQNPYVNFYARATEPDTELGREYGEPVLDTPGNFFYHPILSTDVMLVCGFDADWEGPYLSPTTTRGYVLLGFGTVSNPGRDAMQFGEVYPGQAPDSNLDPHTMRPNNDEAPWGPSGYFSFERDPVAARSTYPYMSPEPLPPLETAPGSMTASDHLYSGPDTWPDFFIILVSGGTDRKPHDTVSNFELNG